IHLSANPKYGSEKKGAPTNYFLVAAPERIRVNCDLRHVGVVLCCDPKIFLHTNPLAGLEENGAFVWESSESTAEDAWERIPVKYRKEIIEKHIRVYILNGFGIAKEATEREDLQTRMQGNSFLGAFFRVSPFLKHYNIPEDEFLATVKAQYEKKFGRFGKAVVESNMTVMQKGFEQVKEVPHGKLDAPDRSTFSGGEVSCCTMPETIGGDVSEKAPLFQMSTFDNEFRAGLGYDQPASPLASVGMVASGTGFNASKYVARREVPVFIAENCTQCMDCITVCPDTALPNTAQDISTVLQKAVEHYVSDASARKALLAALPELEASVRASLLENASDKADKTPFADVVIAHLKELAGGGITAQSVDEVAAILKVLPIAYNNTKAIFSGREKKEAGSGGLFSIFVSDLCKGCAACVEACGSHDALRMMPETEELHAKHQSASEFLNLLSDTPLKYLGIFDAENPEESKAAALKFHLMLRSKYTAMVSGDGACAGCGEKSALRSVATVTEMFMRTVFRKKADRLRDKADKLSKNGISALQELKKKDEKAYSALRRTALHILMGYGRDSKEATDAHIESRFKGSDEDIIKAIADALRIDAANHSDLQAIEGYAPNGMSVMAMTANTGCNTVYGSTPPNNPHPYPWMNSLFQDGSTIGWLVGESFIRDHAARSVIPERLADAFLDSFSNGFSDDDYFLFTHFSDTNMTDNEIIELPKVWAIGGDGGMGDIGFQNMSKVVLQNRPNIKMMMLDTQVYSNTGGQNSDSSPMTGGFDMNQFGAGSEGKLTEMKSVAEAFLGGHGSPFIGQVSMSNAGTLYKAILDALTYRGTAYLQAYTTCQPEHGVPDYASQIQALRARDSRGMPEFVYDPRLGESYSQALRISGNPSYKKDWADKIAPVTKKKYTYTVAHWAFSEPRFRFHHKIIREEQAKGMIRLEDKLQLITMNDIVYRKYLDENHRSYIPDFGVYCVDMDEKGEPVFHALSRQMVIFCVERRKAWRMLQSRAGIVNEDYNKQRELLDKIDSGELSVEDFLKREEAGVV
ncbi:MAG: 2-oxoacid:acceptor oxidoreductase family protein, partial [Flavobacteriales bacterium]